MDTIGILDYIFSLKDPVERGDDEAKVDRFIDVIENIEVVKGEKALLYDELESLEVVKNK
jgi:hypothetical protein